jgi:ABC-type nitrate/sulfonate/bicarbonate transport system substrate-binding protein
VVPAVVEVARRRGFLDAAGVELLTTMTPSSTVQRHDLDSGHVDVAITSTDNLFAWNAAGSDIAVLAQIETTTDLALVLRPGLSSLDALDVVRLGVDAPTNGFAIVAYSMLARLGRTPAQYEVVEVGGVRERFDALAAGSVDASLLAPPLDEIGRARGMSVAMRVSELTPAYPGLGIVARRSLLDTHGDAVAAYLRALDEANRWLREAARADVEQELRDAGLGPAAVDSVLATVPLTLLPSAEGLEVLARLRHELGRTVPGAPAPADLVDLRALQAAGLHPVR